MVGKLLKVANSSKYGTRGEVTDLGRAVMLMGRSAAAPLVLSFSLAKQSMENSDHLEHYRRFLAFRRNYPALVKGEIEFLAVEGDAIAFARSEGNERIVCAFNLGAGPATIDLGTEKSGQSLGGHDFTASAEGDVAGADAAEGERRGARRRVELRCHAASVRCASACTIGAVAS